MAEAKTKPTAITVSQFLDEKVPEADRRRDCETIIELMTKATGQPAVMWGPSIVGFGKYHYKYESGREGDSMVIGFSPRKSDLTLYGLSINDAPDLIDKLGKFKNGKGCLYIKKLSDVNLPTLRELIKRGATTKKPYSVE